MPAGDKFADPLIKRRVAFHDGAILVDTPRSFDPGAILRKARQRAVADPAERDVRCCGIDREPPMADLFPHMSRWLR